MANAFRLGPGESLSTREAFCCSRGRMQALPTGITLARPPRSSPPLGTISATGAADGQRKLEVSGRLLPAAAIPAALFLLTGLAAALNSDGHLSLPARSARAALLLFSLASIVAAATTWM